MINKPFSRSVCELSANGTNNHFPQDCGAVACPTVGDNKRAMQSYQTQSSASFTCVCLLIGLPLWMCAVVCDGPPAVLRCSPRLATESPRHLPQITEISVLKSFKISAYFLHIALVQKTRPTTAFGNSQLSLNTTSPQSFRHAEEQVMEMDHVSKTA